jgi:phosphatidate cytidylyltransferase
VSPLNQRIFVAIILLTLVGAALFYLPVQAWYLFCTVLFVCATFEWAQLAQYNRTQQAVYALLMVGIYYGSIYYLPKSIVTSFYALAMLFWAVVAPYWLKKKWQMAANTIGSGLCGAIILLPAFTILYQVRISPLITQQFLAMIAIIWISDTAAYFAGRIWGRHKLAPTISPGKSWEGVAGALFAVGFYVMILTYFTVSTQPLVIFSALIFAFLFVALGIVGDLLESLFKRQANRKDSGRILPGHGGILDRMDSLLALLPFIGCFIL